MHNIPRISKREFISWGAGGGREEPTETYVLTSPAGHYVDIRILTIPPSDSKTVDVPGIQPLAQLDWAFAGQSSSEIKPDADGSPRVWGRWEHWVDSRTRDAQQVADEGMMLPPDATGLSVEKGRMVHPKHGIEMDYEEGWKEIVPSSNTQHTIDYAVIIMRDSAQEAVGVVVLVGQLCQGVVRFGEALTLERWARTEHEGWKRTVRMGDDFVPCAFAMKSEELRMGEPVKHGGVVWEVVELRS